MSNDNMTMREGRDHIRQERESVNGAICPCCKRTNKLYKRKYSAGMAVFLIGLYRLTQRGGKYFHYTEVLEEIGSNRPGDYAKNIHFGLMHALEDYPEDLASAGVSSTGHFCISGKGCSFVEDFTKISEFVHLMNGRIEHFSGGPITIKEALGNKFNYHELMKGV